MRTIKFRAWDKEENRMLYSEKTYYDIDFKCDENGCLKCYINYSYCDSFGDEYDNWEVLDNIMQYTGLRDRAGKEIYEGDILELVNEADRRIKAICKFGKRRIIHGGNTIEMQGFYFEVEGRKTNPIVCNYKGLHDLEIMEVRGNIYENPELI